MELSHTIAQLEAAVAQSPTDWELRRELVEHLLANNDAPAALGHLELLADVLLTEVWPLRLAVTVATRNGDLLSAARFRARLVDLQQHPEDFQGTSQQSAFDMSTPGVVIPHPKHPSRATSLVRRLQLVIGGTGETIEPSSPSTRLDDVAGIRTIRRNLRELIDDVRNAEIGTHGSWLGGLLLFGPAGCGKSFAAEMIAGELAAPMWTFDLTHKWGRNGLHDAVHAAIERVEHADARVLYFTNVDEPNAMEPLAPLLGVLDRARLNERIVLLASAKAPWSVSHDLLHPDRLGRVLLVLPPDAPARLAYLSDRFRARATISTNDVDWLVQHTDGCSFYDLYQIVNNVIDIAQTQTADGFNPETLRASTSQTALAPIFSHMVKRARNDVQNSSSAWLTTAAQHAMRDKSTGIYDDLLAYLHAREVGSNSTT